MYLPSSLMVIVVLASRTEHTLGSSDVSIMLNDSSNSATKSSTTPIWNSHSVLVVVSVQNPLNGV